MSSSFSLCLRASGVFSASDQISYPPYIFGSDGVNSDVTAKSKLVKGKVKDGRYIV